MYTRCPHCQTVFSLTPAQLKARGGLVRCGRCQQKFQADKFLLDGPLQAVAGEIPRARSGSDARASTPPTPARTGRRRAKHARSRPDDTGHAGKPHAETVMHVVRTRALFWWLGNLLLTAILAGQGMYFYGNALVEAHPALQPVVSDFCDWAGCRLQPRQDVALIDLADAHVEPHPLYDRALRVQAVLVNRAEYAQPHPQLEITLTDREGAIVTRRSFAPIQYLPRDGSRADAMVPGIAVEVQLDLTRPEAHTSGYEIRLLPAR